MQVGKVEIYRTGRISMRSKQRTLSGNSEMQILLKTYRGLSGTASAVLTAPKWLCCAAQPTQKRRFLCNPIMRQRLLNRWEKPRFLQRPITTRTTYALRVRNSTKSFSTLHCCKLLKLLVHHVFFTLFDTPCSTCPSIHV